MCASGAAHYLFLAGDCMIEVLVLGHLPAQYLVYWYYSSMIRIIKRAPFQICLSPLSNSKAETYTKQ